MCVKSFYVFASQVWLRLLYMHDNVPGTKFVHECGYSCVLPFRYCDVNYYLVVDNNNLFSHVSYFHGIIMSFYIVDRDAGWRSELFYVGHNEGVAFRPPRFFLL